MKPLLDHGVADWIADLKRVVLAFQTLISRASDSTNVRPKMGARPWLHREKVG